MVKIDQTFLSPPEAGPEDPAVLQAIIRLAETLRLATICEGIETNVQLNDLQSAGCGYGQGYLLGRPGPIVGIPASIEVITSPAAAGLQAPPRRSVARGDRRRRAGRSNDHRGSSRSTR